MVKGEADVVSMGIPLMKFFSVVFSKDAVIVEFNPGIRVEEDDEMLQKRALECIELACIRAKGRKDKDYVPSEIPLLTFRYIEYDGAECGRIVFDRD